MKKIFICLLSIIIVLGFTGCAKQSDITNDDYLRIHIRANSNSMEDQNVKYLVKDKVVEYLTPLIATSKSKEEMETIINLNLENIEGVANEVLKDNGFEYKSNAYLNNEYFPTRTYGDVTLNADYYDAIIVELGNANGNNWWCVVYPPLCFINSAETSTEGFKYKSLILELINKFFD
jgi:stage II sporulation protein R